MSEEPGATPQVPAVPSADEIAAEVLKQQQALAPAPQPKMTDDELREYLQVWEPDTAYADAFQTAIISEEATPDDRLAAVKTLRDGIVQQAVRGAELLMEEKLQEVDQKYGQASQYAAQAQAEALWNDFADQYPALSEHKQVVDMVSTSLQAQGWKPGTREELYQKVAEGAAGMIQKFDQTFKLDKEQKNGAHSPGVMPDMAGMGGVPGGGAAVAPQGQADDNGVASIWD